MALIATGNHADALDIVQETMMKLAQSYAHKTEDDWTPLFYRILQSKIIDFHRKQTVKKKWLSFMSNSDEENGETPVENYADPVNQKPDDKLRQSQAMTELDLAINQLPVRQQQAFLLRIWEGFDVAQTAKAMGCSQGSVKTHYSRAIHSLRNELKDFQYD